MPQSEMASKGDSVGVTVRLWQFGCRILLVLRDVVCLFFFQAEDGIRDHCVTGVQTCALPISRPKASTENEPFVDAFGRDRVRVTPISETAEIGIAIGAALSGFRPVVELYIDRKSVM